MPAAAVREAAAIREAVDTLFRHPLIGRAVEQGQRELDYPQEIGL